MAEPDWMESISSSTVCNFFYGFFVVYAVLLALSVVALVGVFSFLKLPKSLIIANSVPAIIGLSIVTAQMLFFYLICDRALKPEGFLYGGTGVVTVSSPRARRRR